jgi:hypothetical protein
MKRILSCICLIAVLYSCKNAGSGSPKGAVAAFIEASKNGDIAEIKKHITRSDVSLIEMGESMMAQFDPKGSKDMKEKMAKEFKDKAGNAKIEIKDEKIDGNNATVNVEFVMDGKTENRPFSLLKEDGAWKVSLLSTGMKNAGSDDKDAMEAMKSMNMDSLKGAISQGMEELNKMNKDSLKNAMQEAMKEIEKLKENSKNN